MKYLFLDLETTGLDPTTHGIVQIAGIVEIDGEVKEKFNFKCALFSGQTMSPDALKITGLTPEKIRDFSDPLRTYESVVGIFRKYVDRYNKLDKFFMVGQNTHFDYQFLDKFFRNCADNFLHAYIFYEKIDLIAITALFRSSGLLHLDNVKLETVAKRFDIKYEKHDAASDIAVTREIFHKYVGYLKRDSHPVFGAAI